MEGLQEMINQTDIEDIKEEMTEQEKLEKEIEEKQKRLHQIRYGDIDNAYQEFEKAKEVAIEKYNKWKDVLVKHGQSPDSITYYFRSWRL
jgi:hypothetical protein